MNQFGWGGTTDQITKMVPDAAVDDRRLYVNWFGICFAIDLSTGKMVWRTGSFADLPQQLQQSLMQGQWSGADYSIATAGSRVLYAGRSTNQRNPQQAGNSLLCLNAETGKPIWKSDAGALADWNFTGRPLVRGEIAYVIARSSSAQDLNLLTINLSTGALQAKLILGTPTLGQTMRGTPLAPIPTLEEYRGTIYVLTNNGAVLAVDPAAGRVKWAFTYAAQVDTAQQVFYQPAPASSPIAPGAMLITDNTLLIKEYGGTTIYALDLAGPSLKWKRPIDDSVTIADADAHGLYLIGTEADCIDPVSRDMQWSTELSIDTGFIRPLVSGGHLYVFGQRGVHQVDSASGDTGPIFRGFDHDGTGGALWRTPGRLITISNRAITAYPLGSDATH
jgi:outer membrane protein assembly factor BamB